MVHYHCSGLSGCNPSSLVWPAASVAGGRGRVPEVSGVCYGPLQLQQLVKGYQLKSQLVGFEVYSRESRSGLFNALSTGSPEETYIKKEAQ
jgi:hypothetical protein